MLGSVSGGASISISVEFGVKESQTGLTGLFFFFFEAVSGPRSRGNSFFSGHSLFGATNRDRCREEVAKGRTHSCGGTFHFSEKSKDRVV